MDLNNEDFQDIVSADAKRLSIAKCHKTDGDSREHLRSFHSSDVYRLSASTTSVFHFVDNVDVFRDIVIVDDKMIL